MTGASRVSEAELHAFVDGQLSDERALAVAVWLAENPRDGLRVDGWRGQTEAIQRAFPAPVRERVTLAFRAPEGDGPLTMPAAPAIDVYRARRRRRHTLSLTLAFTAGALLAGGMALGLRRMAAPSTQHEPIFADLAAPSDEFARRAMDAWRTYAKDPVHPVEAPAGDMAALTKWLKDRTGLERPPMIADARLLGGRVLPGHGANTAFLLYRLKSGELVGLLAEPGSRAPGAYAAAGLSAQAWSRDGFDFALAGPIPGRDLDALVWDFDRKR